MFLGPGQQRMPIDQQRSNFPQQMQYVLVRKVSASPDNFRNVSQGNFQMSSNQPPHFQAASSNSQPYLIRNPPQQQSQQVQQSPAQSMQNVMKHSPMPQPLSQQPPSVSNSMQQQRTGPPSASNIPQPRSIHSNYANSPQINQPQSVQNVQNAAPTPRPCKSHN
jgi:hypothetical protein